MWRADPLPSAGVLPRSVIPHVEWPAVPSSRGAMMLALQHQLEHSEWLPHDVLERHQLGALRRLLDHAVRTVPYYRDTPGYAEVARSVAGGDLTTEVVRQLPVLTRPALQESGSAMNTEELPADHGPTGELRTTGSTGRPVRTLATRVTATLWQAITLRDLLWHGRDLTLKLAAVRADLEGRIPPEGRKLASWGSFIDAAYATGPCVTLGITAGVDRQAEWLMEHNPDYLLTYPSNVMALADNFVGSGASLSRLREVWTYGELLRPGVREACWEAWGVEVVDMYSSQEIGYLALQCPWLHTYHVQSEAVYLEVLDAAGSPCSPGEVGRVVVSTLHNYATPLIRYELGDYAEVGGPCPCGRSLPVLNRIVGRQRNMWRLPDGQLTWPMFSSRLWGHIAAIRQLQLVQHEVGHIEARVVGPRALTTAEEQELTRLLRQEFPWRFALTVTCLREIERGHGTKFEDFVSHVGP